MLTLKRAGDKDEDMILEKFRPLSPLLFHNVVFKPIFKVRILSSWDFSLTGHQCRFGVDDAADIACLANKRYHSDVLEKNQNGGWLLNGGIWQRKQRQRRLIK